MEMERKSYCCMAAGAPSSFHGADADVAARLSQIMLRFRPIAPKPVAHGGSSSSSSGSPTATATTTPRGTRRRWCGNAADRRRGRRKRLVPPPVVTAGSEQEVDGNAARLEPPVTLPLMPESPESKEEGPQLVALPEATIVVVVVVDSTTVFTTSSSSSRSFESDAVGRWLCWCREEDARKGLEGDTWPAFVTDDAHQTVRWTNPAFRKMVGSWEDDDDGAGGGVRLEADKQPSPSPSPFGMGFTCWVTVRRVAGGGKGTSSSTLTTAPCDVWRLVDGCLAWRIDVGAALSLWL